MWGLVQVALPTLLVERNTLWWIEHQELLSDCSLTGFICFSSAGVHCNFSKSLTTAIFQKRFDRLSDIISAAQIIFLTVCEHSKFSYCVNCITTTATDTVMRWIASMTRVLTVSSDIQLLLL